MYAYANHIGFSIWIVDKMKDNKNNEAFYLNITQHKSKRVNIKESQYIIKSFQSTNMKGNHRQQTTKTQTMQDNETNQVKEHQPT